jgi:SRSO17 transposase
VTDAAVRKLLARSLEFLENFAGCFGRRSQKENCRRYIRGLLSDSPRKSIQPMVEETESSGPYQSLHHFITNTAWDAALVWKQLRLMAPSVPGVLVVDDTGFPKQGRDSVGVARQYSGTLGKVGNCQIAVATVFATNDSCWPIAFDLYMPQEWTKDRARCERAEVPGSVRFQEKWKIALSQIDRATRNGLVVDAVAADAGYGDVGAFRQGLSDRRLRYVVAISGRTSVKKDGRESAPAVLACDLADTLPASAWRTIRWRKGTKGQLRARFAAVRIRIAHGWKKTAPWPRLEWLVQERSLERGGKRRFYLSNLPPSAKLERMAEIAHRRWRVEEHFERLKSEIGMDHFEGRSWPGWQHHVALAAMSYTLIESDRAGRKLGERTFQAYRRILRRVVLLMMIAEKNADVELVMSFKRDPPPGWGFG